MAFVTSLPLHPFTTNNSPATTTFRRRTSLHHTSAHPHLFPAMTLDVLVTGAAGRTGSLVLKLLQEAPDTFTATGLVRDIARATETLGSASGLQKGDITDATTLEQPFTGRDALVLLTSAIPRMHPSGEGQPPTFYYEEGGMPEQVDWIGACNQIDTAKRLGISHIVFVGSMGSTDDNNSLNKIGNGNILKFKRKAEKYLIASGVPYTIINPSGLLSDPPSEREILSGSNDDLFSIYDRMESGIPRADVARIVVAALTTESARNKVFDVIGRPKGRGNVTTDFSHIFESAPPVL